MSRCVICGYPKDQHGADLLCPGSAGTVGKRYASMDLPEGQTCSGCGHFGFCRKFIGEEIADNITCDWYPIRFVYPAPRPAHVEHPQPISTADSNEAKPS
jgi:hypothetical protein